MEAGANSNSHCLWTPDPSRETKCDAFRKKVNEKYGLQLGNYEDLYKWSVEHYPEFWEEVWHFGGVKSSQLYEQVVDKSKGIADIPQWFSGSRLNFAENLLKYNDDRVAIYATAEPIPASCKGYVRPAYAANNTHPSTNGKRKSKSHHKERSHKRSRSSRDRNEHVQNGHAGSNTPEKQSDIRQKTFAELRKDVAKYAAAMRKMGVQKGDRVVGYLPNSIEVVEAMLAATSIGAIWSSTSPDFGVTGVLDRFSQIQPKLIVSINAVVYNGKIHNHMEKLEQVVNGLPDLERVVVVPYVVKETEPLDVSNIKHGMVLDEFLATGLEGGVVPELKFEQVPFNHPLYIMYSSGTTGAPKCMIHSVGGTLLKHLEEHILQGDMRRDDILLYYTTTGWMMWNWFVSALAVGAAIVCYDGSPFMPTPSVLWDVIDKLGVTILGTGAKWLQALEEKKICPMKSHSLKTLHSLYSTGSPLKPQSYDYVYHQIKEDILLGSITGGTDIIGCFAGHSKNLPVHRGEIQCRLLGMAMEAWDDDGKPRFDESAELVCTKPFPSMPTHFWKDTDGIKYKKAYFNKFEGVWTHGDFCYISSKTGGIWMLGRSDGTLNPSGVRFGSAEIYHIVESFKEIQDSLCVGQQSSDKCEERVVLFLQMAPGSEFSPELVKRLCTDIRAQLSARHVPTMILETKDIPYTQSGKKVEVAVKKILAGEEVRSRGAYANPNSLDLYANIPELQGY